MSETSEREICPHNHVYEAALEGDPRPGHISLRCGGYLANWPASNEVEEATS